MMSVLFQCVIKNLHLMYLDPLSVNETDQEWTDLFNEIDDLQHWMVQQKSKENLLKKLSQLGWKY